RRLRDSLLSPAVPPLILGLGLAAALDLEWRAPADCPPARPVAAAAAEMLGRPPEFGHARSRGRRRAAVTPGPRGFRLHLELTSDAGVDRRSLHDRRCQVLADAAAEILATAIDPSLGAVVVPPVLPPLSVGPWPKEHDLVVIPESTPAP